MVGDQGLVYYTSDGGSSWSDHSIGISDTLESITFVGDMDGWVAGQNGSIYYTSNGGDNWEKQESGTLQWLYDIQFTDLNNGWVVGDGGSMLYTSDGGLTWTSYIFSYQNLYGIYFTDSDNGWAVGDGGSIIHTGNGTTVDLDNIEVKVRKKLQANAYPNPFSSQITIQYELVQAESVSLSVFNHLGQIVYRFNQNQPKGRQQILFNAAELSDGIYYYQLQAGMQVSNGKLLKVK